MADAEGRHRTVTHRTLTGAVTCALCSALAVAGCRAHPEPGMPGPSALHDPHGPLAPIAPDGRSLLRVSLPDLSKMVPSVQKQIRESHESLLAHLETHETSIPELADAYGALGKLLTAADYPDAAEPGFL